MMISDKITLFQALKCGLGIHEWEKNHSMSLGEFDGYLFLPSILTFYHCKHCFSTMQERINFKGEFLSRHYDKKQDGAP